MIPIPIVPQVVPRAPAGPFLIEDPATEMTKRRPGARSTLQSYLPTIALAAVIGAGLGSIVMALAPLVH